MKSYMKNERIPMITFIINIITYKMAGVYSTAAI